MSRSGETPQSYYSVVRYVPDPLRNEPRNIGVIVLCPQGSYSKGRFSLSRSGLRPTSSKYLFLQTILADLQLGEGNQPALFDLRPDFTLERLDDLHRESTNTIQFTEPIPVPARPESLLNEVYADFVASRGGGGGAWSRGDALKVFQREFQLVGLERFVRDTASIRLGDDAPYVFDLGIQNGSWRAVIENISLMNQDSRHPEEKAAWMSRAWEHLSTRISARAFLFVETASNSDPRFHRVSEWATRAGVSVERADAAPRVAAELARELSRS
jgi:hypothetical protein